MTKLFPKVTFNPDETPLSWAARQAAFHIGRHLLLFLNDLQIPASDLARGLPEAVLRLCDMAGQDPAPVLANAIAPVGTRRFRLRREEFSAEFTTGQQTRFCPRCLVEDQVETDYPDAAIRHRLLWRLSPVRTCPRHRVPLRNICRNRWSDQLHELQGLRDLVEAEIALCEKDVQRAPSPLQTYLENRLEGRVGPSWLDSQDIDQASRASEMLGVILTAGTHAKLPSLSEGQWNEAGQVGYSFTSRGEAGVREALQIAFDRFEKSGARGGPQKVYGRLYQWIQFRKSTKPLGPIREVVREFILDQFPIEAGTDLFGEKVDRQRVHSVHSLAAKTGLHQKTLNRALVGAGLLAGDPNSPVATKVCAAQDAEAMAERLHMAISKNALPAYINCNRVQALQLVQTGLIPKLFPETAGTSGMLGQVARDDADAFLTRLMSAATTVDEPSEQVVNIVAAAEAARWPAIDIIKGILDGLFETVEIEDPSLKFKAVLIDPSEVREVLLRTKGEGLVDIQRAAQILTMSPTGVRKLTKLRNEKGEPFLPVRFIENGKGVHRSVLAIDDINQFLRDHISLTDFAGQKRIGVRALRRKLDMQGHLPIAELSELERLWYRRQDVCTGGPEPDSP